MADSKQIAGLLGPTVVAVTLSEALNLHIWEKGIPQLTYLNGLLLFVAGLSVVRVHRVRKGWPLLVSLAGWFLLLFGLYRLFFPEAKQASESITSYAGIFLLFACGVFLCIKGYSREGNKNSGSRE